MNFNVEIIKISNMGTPSLNDQTLSIPSLSRNIFLKGGNPTRHICIGLLLFIH